MQYTKDAPLPPPPNLIYTFFSLEIVEAHCCAKRIRKKKRKQTPNHWKYFIYPDPFLFVFSGLLSAAILLQLQGDVGTCLYRLFFGD